jgi:hypothetical protein
VPRDPFSCRIAAAKALACAFFSTLTPGFGQIKYENDFYT